MTNEHGIEIRFTGPEMRPGIVRATDLADVLRAIDEMIESVAMNEHVITDMPLVTSLTVVKEGSLTLQFTPSNAQVGMFAWQVIGNAIHERVFQRLPRRATRAIRRVVEFVQTYNCMSEFRLVESEQVLAILPPDLIVADASLITGETALYGQVIRVGGRRPKVLIAALDRSGTIACDVNEEIARILGRRLYTDIGVSGIATWNSETLKIESFRIQELLPYQKVPLSEAFHRLSEQFGNYYDQFGDVDALMSSIRGDKE